MGGEGAWLPQATSLVEKEVQVIFRGTEEEVRLVVETKSKSTSSYSCGEFDKIE